jgi:hypothetical protein
VSIYGWSNYGYIPIVIRPNYYVKAHKTTIINREDCELDFSHNPYEPQWKCPEEVKFLCAFGELYKDKCYLGTAPDGTRADIDINRGYFVYYEIPRIAPTPTPQRTPPPTDCPSGYHPCPEGCISNNKECK